MSLRRLRSCIGSLADRRRDQRRQAKRHASRQYLLQQLEDRRLLAGPDLIAIRPDAQGLLDDGDTLDVAPREFNLLFKGGANLDASTINSDSIKLIRAGGDGSFSDGNEVDVALGYIGLANPGSNDPGNLQRIVFRTASSASHNATDPASAFPDDLYQIQIIGSGSSPLTNLSGEAFNDGEDVTTSFRLDRGAQVVSIVPQPIRRGTNVQASDEIQVFFDDQDLEIGQATDPAFYRLVETGGSLSSDDDRTLLPQTVTYDSGSNMAVLTFATAIPEGTYRLDIGGSDGDTSSLSGAIQVGTLFNGNNLSHNGFIGDAGGVSNDASDVDLYEIDLAAGSVLTTSVTPHTSTLALSVRLLDRDGNQVAGTSFLPGDSGSITFAAVNTTDRYYLELASADGSTGSYRVQASVTGNPLINSDDNSTVDTATDLGSLGAAGVTVQSQIQRQSVLLPARPGSVDEPGHRQIQREAHIGAFGTPVSTPSPITVRRYYFPDNFGNDPQGQPYQNLITEAEKQIVREIYEIYAQRSGFEFIETSATSFGSSGTAIGKGDLRALNPEIGPNDGVGGLGGSGAVMLNNAIFDQATRTFGDGFTGTMFHEIGHSLGLGHSYELPSTMGDSLPNDVDPGDHDIVHLQRIVPPNATDIDMYRFELKSAGRLRAETVAERLSTPSLLNSALQLYRETSGGDIELVAQNDQYFGADSFMEVSLNPGVYFIGVTSTGNTQYDPRVPDSGFGGTTDGAYHLQLSFEADRGSTLRDADGTDFDGDADGLPGGVHSFWFQASDPSTTIFVGKRSDTTAGPEGQGTLSSPYDEIDFALQRAANRIVIPVDGAASIAAGEQFVIDDGLNQVTFEFGVGGNRIDLSGATSANDVAAAVASAINASAAGAGGLTVGVSATIDNRIVNLSGIDRLDLDSSPTLLKTPNLVHLLADEGNDADISTLADNRPYLVGLDTSGNPLPDGAEFLVPQGVTVMIQAGSLMKMRKANIDAGSSSANISRSRSSIQVLGTPEHSVFLRSLHNDSVGGDSDGVGPAANTGDFGGIVFRADSDMEDDGVFLNYVNHADINNGGGKVFVDANEIVFTPIDITDARPTVSFNRITASDDAALSATPDSFDDSLGRIGPDVHGNFLQSNTIDGLFIEVETPTGSTINKLTVPGRLNDTDITHVLSENLIVAGAAGGPFLDGSQLTARQAGRLMLDPGLVLKLNDARIEAERGSGAIIAEGTLNRPIVLTSLADDRFGGSGSFDSNRNGGTAATPGDWGGIYLGQGTSGSIDHAIIAYGGGITPVEGGAAGFSAIEVHQADLRLANSTLQFNAADILGGIRRGRGVNAPAVVYARGSQPIIVDNTFTDNLGAAININANSLNFESIRDSGRATGRAAAYGQFADNHGPLVRLNRLGNNSVNGMQIRGEELTTESVWDDTDIVHVLRDEIIVDNHHTYSGLTLQSSNSESLVVKLAGNNAGFTATGTPLEIVDRIGGTIHVLGTVGHPVVITHLADDSVGAGFTPQGTISRNTNNSNNLSTGVSGGWRGFLFDEYSNDRNVAVVRELENPLTNGRDVNSNPANAQQIGKLAPDQKSGDENQRLGFEVKGYISPTDPDDVDVYAIEATAGTPVWLDVDRSDPNLDAIIEVVNAQGTVLARSMRSGNPGFPGSLNAQPLTQNSVLGGDHYTQNFRDPGLYYVLPGTPGVTGTYFIRVRSAPNGQVTDLAGESRGEYRLQVRLDQVQEFPGSTVQLADIRFAKTGIDVRGLPSHSPLIGEAGELAGDSFDSAQPLINLMESDLAALGIGGELSSSTDVDWYEFDLQQVGVQVISGVNDDPGTVSLVFDIDYADGAVRADTTIAIFDSARNLIYAGRESDVQDDQAADPSGDVDDLSRGSLGKKDPFVGPVHLVPNGTYYVAVMSDRILPSAMTGAFVANPANQGNGLVRLEPVNSLRRVVEDHIGFQGYTTGDRDNNFFTPRILPETPQGLFDISSGVVTSGVGVDAHVTPFSLDDVALYVATDRPETDTDQGNFDHLYTVDAFRDRRWLTRVNTADSLVDGSTNDVQDITIRSDGRMYGVRRLDGNNSEVGELVQIQPEDGSISVVGPLGVRGESPTPNTSDYSVAIQDNTTRQLRADQFTISDEVDALTFKRTGTRGPGSAPIPEYDVYYVVRESNTTSKLYRGTEAGDASLQLRNNSPFYGVQGDIQPAGVTYHTQNLRIRGVPPANGATPFTDIRVKSKVAGEDGSFNVVLETFRPDDTSVRVRVLSDNTISLRLGATGGPPPTNAPSAGAIVDAINSHPTASQLVTAVIFDGNSNNRGDGSPGVPAIRFSSFTTLNGSDGSEGPLEGRVTGISFGNFYGTGNLYGVTDAGEFLEINPNSGTVVNRVRAEDSIGVAGLSFQGLTLGPQNLMGGRYQNTLFAVADDGRLVAFDTDGNGVFAFEATDTTQIVQTAGGATGGFFTLTTAEGGFRETTNPIEVDAPGTFSVNETQSLRIRANSGQFTLSVVDDFAAVTSPQSPLNASDSIFVVQDGSEFPTSPFVIQVEDEQMLVTSRTGNLFFVNRGHNGTVAAAHPDTSTVFEVRSTTLASAIGVTGTSALTGDIDDTTTTVTVANASGMPTTPFTIRVGREEMLVTNVSGNDLTVERGKNGTTATAHEASDAVQVVSDQLVVTDTTPLPSGSFNIRIGNEDIRVVSQAGNTFEVIRGINGTSVANHAVDALIQKIDTTAALPHNASNAAIDAALEALPSIGFGNVQVTAGPLGPSILNDPVEIQFTGALAAENVQQLTVDQLTLGRNEFQTVSLDPEVSAGTFVLDFNGQQTGNLDFNITASDFEDVLEGLSGIGVGNVRVTGTNLDAGPLTIEFTGALEDQNVPNLTLSSEALLRNEQQSVTIFGTPSGGNFTLDLDDTTLGITGSSNMIPFNASAAVVQSAIEAGIPELAGNVQVTGGPLPGNTVTIEFTGTLAGNAVAEFTATDNLTGGPASISITEIRDTDAAPPTLTELLPGGAVSTTVATDADGVLSVRDALLDLFAFNSTDITTGGILQQPGNGVGVIFGGQYAGQIVAPLEVDNFLNDPTSTATVTTQATPGSGLPGRFMMQVSGLNTGGADAIGLTFSPLDFNLWHPTTKRATDAGHGINPVHDGTRTPSSVDIDIPSPGDVTRDSNEAEGGASFHFGFERWLQNQNADTEAYLTYGGANAQFGILNTDYHSDLSSNASIANSYNMPAGALGSLTTNSFSLSGSKPTDRPTLYFNYFLETEQHPGSNLDSNDNDPFRDSARVFVSRNNGATWELVATNSSRLSGADPFETDQRAELPGFLSHLSDAGLNSSTPRSQSHQIVQELMDNTGQWRQARVDLSTFADEPNLRLRVDFSTAGAMDDNSLGLTDSGYGEYVSPNNFADQRSIRSRNNQFEGFYIDDIIVGYSERGEMVTGTNGDAGVTNLFAGNSRTRDRDPEQFPDILDGRYQLEIRRSDEHVFINESPATPIVGFTFDTNDRHIPDPIGERREADRNRERAQGMLILDSNFVRDSEVRGINVEPGATQAGGSVPHPGSTINFPQINTERLVPGVVIENNVIAGSDGIRFAGESSANPQRPVPFGRIVNNTVIGDGSGTGINVVGLASPTLMNNLVTQYRNGIVDGGVGTVIRSNYFQDNNNNGNTGTAAIQAPNNSPLFVDASVGNYYLEAGSLALDSSQNTEQDRQNFLTFKRELGIGASPIQAPDRDVYGQLRVDSSASPGGGGSQVFKDRGAVDRADKDAPYASLLNPIDNDASGEDRDPSDTVVFLTDPLVEDFTILLGDGRGPNAPFEGTGVDGLTVDDPADPTISAQAITIEQDGVPLVQGVDYSVGYNELSGILRLTPLSTLWEQSSVYFISLDNTLIADRAGNFLRSNQPGGETQFTIIIPEVNIDYGDAPDSYRTLQSSDGARHTFSDQPDIFLGASVDGEPNGRPSVGADGDDTDNEDDENGVPVGEFIGTNSSVDGLFLADPAQATTFDPNDVVAFLNRNDAAGALLPITVTGDGVLDAWIDFNADGDFADLGERVADGVAVSSGANTVRVFTPAGAAAGLTYARFRVSKDGSENSFGLAIGGEVEDYRVRILDVAAPTLTDDAYTVDEDTQLVVDGTTLPTPLANDGIPPDEFVQERFTIVGAQVLDPNALLYRTTHGQLRVDDPTTGAFTYTPDPDYYGPDSFTYTVSTQRNEGPEFDAVAQFVTVNLTVDPVNDAPGVSDKLLRTSEDIQETNTTDGGFLIPASVLLGGTTPDADPNASGPPQDESNQQIFVQSIGTVVGGNAQTLDASNAGAELDTLRGGKVSATFDVDGNLVSLLYKPAQDFNSENLPANVGEFLDDEILFTVIDDGISEPVGGGTPAPADPTISTATAFIRVTPQNDPPIAVSDDISITDPNGAYTTFFTSQGLSVPTPTEDQNLVVPIAFLLDNDMQARATAADENAQFNGNDGPLKIIDVQPVDPSLVDSIVLNQNTGEIVIDPADDIFGEILFTYTLEDSGIDQDAALDIDGNPAPKEPAFLTSTVTASVFFEPVNDAPQAVERIYNVVEAIESRPPDAPVSPASITITANELLNGGATDLLNPTLAATASDIQLAAPYNENNQSLSVNSITTEGVTLSQTGTLTTRSGGQLAAEFDANGLLVQLTYTPPVDFNSTSAFFGADDTFTYTVVDDGTHEFPVGNPLTPDTAPLTSAPATVRLTVTPANDLPVFNVPASTDILERDDRLATRINGFFTGVGGGPLSTALDEQAPTQTVSFSVRPLSITPAGLMTQDPDVSSGSFIDFYPAPDQFGTAVYEVTGTDSGGQSISKTFTINVRPVNDAPRFDPNVAGTSDAASPDEAYSVGNIDSNGDGTIDNAPITYTLREDNTQAGGVTSPYFIPLRATNDPGYNRLGLLDVFTVGPGNEDGPLPGGSQVLDFLQGGNPPIAPSLERSTDRGGTLSPVFDNSGQLIGLNYQPPTDFNVAFAGRDSFSYTVRDRSTTGGETWNLAAGALTPDRLTATNRVELVLNPVNDRPEFSLATDRLTVREDSSEVTFISYASNISAGPPNTAFDEVDINTGQLVDFRVTPLDFNAAEASSFFATMPTIDEQSGLLTFQPAANVFGEFRFEVVLADRNRDGSLSNDTNRGDLNESLPKTVTIDVQPINDPPIVDPNAAPLSFQMLEDGTFDILVTGDNTSPGLLDPFLPGPNVGATDESADIAPRPGGNQTVSLGTPIPRTSAQGGTIQLVTTGGSPRLVYTPRPNFVGTDSFIYTVIDDGETVDINGNVISDPRIASNTVTFDVLPVNDAPLFSGAGDVNSLEDQGGTGLVSIDNWATNVQAGPTTAFDENAGLGATPAQDLQFKFTQLTSNPELFSTPPSAIVDPTTGNATLTYQTAPDANGTAVFEVVLEDNGPRNAGIGDEFVSDPPRTFTINVEAVNDPPSFDLASPVITRQEDSGPFSFMQAINISPGPQDERTQTVTFDVEPLAPQFTSLFSAPPTINSDGVLRFTPAANRNTDNADGPAVVRVVGRDSEGAVTDPLEFQIVINEVNDAPRAVSDELATNEDVVLTFDESVLKANDIDPDLQSNENEVVRVVMPAESSSVSGAKLSFDSATGQITYDPTSAAALQALGEGETLIDSFAYSLVDAAGASSNLVTVSIEVTGINDAPKVVDDLPRLEEDGPTLIPVLDNDTDIDGTIDASSLQVVLQPAFGSLTILPGGIFRYQPFNSFNNEDIFSYRVADEKGDFSGEAFVTVSDNASPRAVDDAKGTFLDEPIFIDVAANDSDPDGTLDLASIEIVTPPEHGQAIPRNDGTVQYIPETGFIGRDSFTYRIFDDRGRPSNVATVDTEVVASRLQNPDQSNDVNDDGAVSAQDALLIINHLSRNEAISIPVLPTDRGPRFYDTNGNQVISAADALKVINALSRQSVGGGIDGEQILPAETSDESEVASAVTEPTPIDLSGADKIVDVAELDAELSEAVEVLANKREESRSEESTAAIDAAMADLL